MHRCVFIRHDGLSLVVNGQEWSRIDLDDLLRRGARLLRFFPTKGGLIVFLECDKEASKP